MTTCELPRPTTLADTPHTMVDADMKAQRHEITTLDLAGCNVSYINVSLKKGEEPGGHRFEQWPAEIQHAMEYAVRGFIERNAGASVRAVTTGVQERICVLAIHWRPKQ